MVKAKLLRKDPIFYRGKKIKKGETFELDDNDGVVWGPGVIEVLKIKKGEKAPKTFKEPEKEKEPESLREMSDREQAAREATAASKGIPPGEMP